MPAMCTSDNGSIRKRLGAFVVVPIVFLLVELDCKSSGNSSVDAGRGGDSGGRGGSGGAACNQCLGMPPGCSEIQGCSSYCGHCKDYAYRCDSDGQWVTTLSCHDFPPSHPACGDGLLDINESCDDGNTESGDGCNRHCQIEGNWNCPRAGQPCIQTSRCGDGVVTSNETCDDGNTVDGDGCSSDCQAIEFGWQCRVPGRRCTPLCGDHYRVGGEECDDGNSESGDGCSQTCLNEVDLLCPRVDADGSCDGGVQPVCGDGIVTPDEACDDGSDPTSVSANADNAYGGCTTACTLGPYCGDGIVNGQEECDLGHFNGEYPYADLCTVACTKPHYCGDGILDTDRGEACDLGTLNGQQDCTAGCTFLVF